MRDSKSPILSSAIRHKLTFNKTLRVALPHALSSLCQLQARGLIYFFLTQITASGLSILTGVIKVSHLPFPPPSAWGGPRKLRLDYQVPLGRQEATRQGHLQDICLHGLSPFAVSAGQESPPSPPWSLVTGL